MIRLGSETAFRIAGQFLKQHLTERMLCDELGVPTLERFRDAEPGRVVKNVIARVFFRGAYVSAHALEPLLGPEVLAACESLGLLEKENDKYLCPVQLYPIRGAIIASDRVFRPDGSMIEDPDREIVFLALTHNSQIFLNMVPETACDAMLDLGAGSGAAALGFAHTAREIWATDIAERSVHFAEFNTRLNGISNVHNLQGSVYDPVQGLTFDRIITHPPYDPSLASHWVFSDGGDDGEAVLRKIITDLPVYLRPGGQLFLLARGGDRRGQRFEERLREWLGTASSEFDIVAIVRDVNMPQEYAFGAVMTTSKDLDDFNKHMKRFREREIEQLVYCSFLIERHSAAAEPLTIRRNMGERASARELVAALELERAMPSMRTMDLRFRTSESCELHTRHVWKNNELTPAEYWLEIKAPFAERVPCPEWVARVLASCNGKYTGRQLLDYIRKEDPISESDFSAALKRLVAVGALLA